MNTVKINAKHNSNLLSPLIYKAITKYHIVSDYPLLLINSLNLLITFNW